jgi:alkylation response protein AidB-like acyl-CoA dehydrogenase
MTSLLAPLTQAVEVPPVELSLFEALARIAARADSLDRAPRFPLENISDLCAAGALSASIETGASSLARDVALVRAVASVDASTARILDGHLNGVERLALNATPELRVAERDALARGELLLGVWGADPTVGEGPPAHIVRGPDGALSLRGVKTFCSGAGGVQRALVLAREEHGAKRVAYVDCARGLQIDRDWYKASGLRSSESHRVQFIDTPILALLGSEDELLREPWFSGDAVRTAATWAGIADSILDASLTALLDYEPDEMQLHALGEMRVARGSIDRWLEHAVKQLESPEDDPTGNPRALTVACRVAIVDAARRILLEATRACGSRALANGGKLDRARRDLDLFVLQHRLDPKLVGLGRLALEAHTK